MTRIHILPIWAFVILAFASCGRSDSDCGCAGLDDIVMGDSYFVDTVCVVGGKSYCVIDNPDYGQRILYSADGVLADNPLLQIDSLGGTRFVVSCLFTKDTVDFADEGSLRTLSNLCQSRRTFKRERYCFKDADGINAAFSFVVDRPLKAVSWGPGVDGWIASNAMDSVVVGDDVDFEDVAREQACEFFSEFERGEEQMFMFTGGENYLAYEVTKGYVTYLVYAFEFVGGAHGMYTTEFMTYDLLGMQPVTNTYLYKEGAEQAVLDLLYRSMADNEDFKSAHDASTPEQVQLALEAWDVPSLSLPSPALLPQGVVYCFQPYELGSYCEGAYQFVIPYDKLLPYLTDDAMRTAGLK